MTLTELNSMLKQELDWANHIGEYVLYHNRFMSSDIKQHLLSNGFKVTETNELTDTFKPCRVESASLTFSKPYKTEPKPVRTAVTACTLSIGDEFYLISTGGELCVVGDYHRERTGNYKTGLTYKHFLKFNSGTHRGTIDVNTTVYIERKEKGNKPMKWVNDKPDIKNTIELEVGNEVVVEGCTSIQTIVNFSEDHSTVALANDQNEIQSHSDYFETYPVEVVSEDMKYEVGDIVTRSPSDKTILRGLKRADIYESWVEGTVYRVIRENKEETLKDFTYEELNSLPDSLFTRLRENKGYTIKQLKKLMDEGYIIKDPLDVLDHDYALKDVSGAYKFKSKDVNEAYINAFVEENELHLIKQTTARAYLSTYQDNKPSTSVEWKNPKPFINNTLELNIGDKVVTEGTNSILSVVSYDTVSKYYKLQGAQGTGYSYQEYTYPVEKVPSSEGLLGDIICDSSDDIIGFAMGAVKMPEDQLHTVYRVQRITQPKQPKLEAIKYTCGTVVDSKSKEVLTNTKGYTIEVIKDTLEHTNIAKHYSIDTKDIKPKEDSIMAQLKVTLDHKLNVANSEWALILGESGSGKTSIAIDYAKRKKVPSVVMQGTNQLTVDDLLGYKSITTGEYVSSLLRDAVEKGKVFILDEIDACNANTLLALNSLKSTHFQFPDKRVKIHKNFRFIATANTLEQSENYLRNPLDIATIHRFDVIEYNLKDYELALRYGLKYISNLDLKKLTTPRVIERAVTKLKIDEEVNKITLSLPIYAKVNAGYTESGPF